MGERMSDEPGYEFSMRNPGGGMNKSLVDVLSGWEDLRASRIAALRSAIEAVGQRMPKEEVSADDHARRGYRTACQDILRDLRKLEEEC